MGAGATAVIVGTGPGLGAALMRRAVADGMRVAAVARNGDRVQGLVAELKSQGTVQAYPCDATDESAVQKLFAAVQAEWGSPQLVVYNAGAFVPAEILKTEAADFERCWRVGCLGGFLVGREAARLMLENADSERGKGTILFTGATASVRGSARFHNLAVGKFGLRALSQSMARELGPQGIHVGHVIIDGIIQAERAGPRAKQQGVDALLHPEAIAAAYFALHHQHRSAWTQELDLRPWAEKF